MVHNATSTPFVLPFGYQARGIPFAEWLAQLTLCLTPFAAHILTGIPKVVTLQPQITSRDDDGYEVALSVPLLWRIPLLNPITIIWRYVMLTDRRIRAISWRPEDMAGSNAAFWVAPSTAHRTCNTRGRICAGYFNTSPTILLSSRRSILSCPARKRVSWMSISVLGTVIVAFQGIQALYLVFAMEVTHVSVLQGISALFLPLAIGSLFRLPCALWISDEWAYDEGNLLHELNQQPRDKLKGGPTVGKVELQSLSSLADSNSMNDRTNIVFREISTPIDSSTALGPLTMTTTTTERQAVLQPARYLPAFLFRAFFLIVLAGMTFGLGIGHLVGRHDVPISLASLSIHITYTSFLALFLVLTLYYFSTGADDILPPCVNSLWYVCATIVWYIMLVTVFIINALEMRRTSCGVYTTYPPEAGLDVRFCSLFGVA